MRKWGVFIIQVHIPSAKKNTFLRSNGKISSCPGIYIFNLLISWLDLHKWLVFCASKNLNQQFSTLCLYSHAIVDRNKKCWLMLKATPTWHSNWQFYQATQADVIVWRMCYIHMLKTNKKTDQKQSAIVIFLLTKVAMYEITYFASNALDADQRTPRCEIKDPRNII